MNPTKQGSTLLSRRDVVLSLWYTIYDSTLDFFFSQKATKKEKITDIPWGNKEQNNRDENENPIILALLIRQEAVLSL